MLNKVIIHLEDILIKEHRNDNHVRQGIREMIESLMVEGIQIVLITEREAEVAAQVVQKLQIEEYISRIFSKKHTKDFETTHLLETLNRQNIFMTIQETMGIEAEECLAILAREEDVRAAKMANVPSIGYIDKRHAGFSESQVLTEGFEEIDSKFIIHVHERANKIPWVILETERCIVREMTVDDIDELYEIYSDPEVSKFMEPLFENKQDEKAYQKAYIERVYEFYEYGLWAVIHKETGKLIGRAGINNRELKGYIELELGYVIGVPYQHQGYGTEVCSAIIEYVREKFGFETINCFIQKDNMASVGLAKKLKFDYKEDVQIGEETLQRYILQLRG